MFARKSKQIALIILICGGLALALLVLLMNAFSPDQFVPIGTLVVFALIYVFCFAVFFLLHYLFSSVFRLFMPNQGYCNSYRHYFYVAVFSAVPVVMLAIQSIRGISVIEVCLILMLSLLICLYISRR